VKGRNIIFEDEGGGRGGRKIDPGNLVVVLSTSINFKKKKGDVQADLERKKNEGRRKTPLTSDSV